MSPFEAVFGRTPPSLADYLAGLSTVAAVEDLLKEPGQVLNTLCENLQHAQLRMRNQANLGRTDVQFNPGDWVLLKLQPYRQLTLARRSSFKLARRFFGPFQIQERVGVVAYRLQLPASPKIHNVFHVSRLKLYKGDLPTEMSSLPGEFIQDHPVLEPNAILRQRDVIKGGQIFSEVLVQWKDQPVEDATWEDIIAFKQTFPRFVFEDKDHSKGRQLLHKM